MSENTDTFDAANWTDNREKQATLDVGARCEHTKNREPRIDDGASETFADDRNRDAEKEADEGKQTTVAAEKIEGQADLTGGQATTHTPEWYQEGADNVEKTGKAAARGITAVAMGKHKSDEDDDVDRGRGIETDGGEDIPICPECGGEHVVKAGATEWNCEDCAIFFVPGEERIFFDVRAKSAGSEDIRAETFESEAAAKKYAAEMNAISDELVYWVESLTQSEKEKREEAFADAIATLREVAEGSVDRGEGIEADGNGEELPEPTGSTDEEVREAVELAEAADGIDRGRGIETDGGSAELLQWVHPSDAPDDALDGRQLVELKQGVRAAIENNPGRSLGTPGDLNGEHWNHAGIGVSVYMHTSGVVVMESEGDAIVTDADTLDHMSTAIARFHAVPGSAAVATDDVEPSGEIDRGEGIETDGGRRQSGLGDFGDGTDDETDDEEPEILFKFQCQSCSTTFTAADSSADCVECGRKHPDNVGFVGDADLAERIEAADLPDDVDPSRLDATTAREVLERIESDESDGIEYVDPRDEAEVFGSDGWKHYHVGRFIDDVVGSQCHAIAEISDRPGDLIKLADNTDDLADLPGIGDATAAAIRRSLPSLRAAGFSKYDGILAKSEDSDDVETDGGETCDGWDAEEAAIRARRLALDRTTEIPVEEHSGEFAKFGLNLDLCRIGTDESKRDSERFERDLSREDDDVIADDLADETADDEPELIDSAPTPPYDEHRVWKAESHLLDVHVGDWLVICPPGTDPETCHPVQVKYDRLGCYVYDTISGKMRYLKSSPRDGFVLTTDEDAPFWECEPCDVYHVATADDRPARPYRIGETVRCEIEGSTVTADIVGSSATYRNDEPADDLDRSYSVRIDEHYGSSFFVTPDKIDGAAESEPIDEPEPAVRRIESDDASSTTRAVADGGQEPDESDDTDTDEEPEELPKNETVRLITGITGLMHSPEIVEGETSSTGKTISVDTDRKTVRLDTETILSGDSEFRKPTYYELYTPGRFRKNQRANHAPGPQAGANQVSEPDDLPAPTHWPRIEQPDDVPEECPACGSTEAPYQIEGVTEPRCEACGELVGDSYEDQEEDDEDDSDPDALDMQTWERGGVIATEGLGELMITKLNQTRTAPPTTTSADAVDKTRNEYRIRTFNSIGSKVLLVERDGEASPVVFVDEKERFDRDQVEYIGTDEERLRTWIREVYYADYHDDDDRDGSGGIDDDSPDQGGDSPTIVTDGGYIPENVRTCAKCDSDAVDGSRFCESHQRRRGIDRGRGIETDGGLKKVHSTDELLNGALYSYGGSLQDRQVFRLDLEFWNPETDSVDPTATLHYQDGYVADVPRENFERHISEGKVWCVNRDVVDRGRGIETDGGQSLGGSTQAALPGTDPLITRYKCGHGKDHSVPSEDVRVIKFGVGFVAYCTCGGHDLETAAEAPHVLGDHLVLLGGRNLDSTLWLALDDVSNGWWGDPDDAGFSSKSPREMRQELRESFEDPNIDRGEGIETDGGYGVSERCPSCRSTGPFSSPTFRQRRCNSCSHHGPAETFRDLVDRGDRITTDGGQIIDGETGKPLDSSPWPDLPEQIDFQHHVAAVAIASITTAIVTRLLAQSAAIGDAGAAFAAAVVLLSVASVPVVLDELE